MNKELNDYMDYIRTNYEKWSGQAPTEVRIRMIEEFKASVRFVEGSKYIKVVAGSSVHSFIVKKDGQFLKGDILKAATWSAPARNFIRGNVLRKEYGTISWTGA